MNASPLDLARNAYRPALPALLQRELCRLAIREGEATRAVADDAEIRALFARTHGRPAVDLEVGATSCAPRPLTMGVVLSGGQAPGGHNVISGLFDAIRAIHPAGRLLGFRGGPRGILEGDCRELDEAAVEPYRNTGGFDLIGSGRDKIETDAQRRDALAVCARLGLHGLVIVGGDDSNTNAAVLAESFLEQGCSISVLGVPKTIDGDLKDREIEISFGFDTATKVYSELIGNICRDAKSAGKYWHFIKLMGRSASHVTLECALQTHPNVALIAEEVRDCDRTLAQVIDGIACVVKRRAEAGRCHGVCLVPEGLIEFIPEMRTLIEELNRSLTAHAAEFASADGSSARLRLVRAWLSAAGRAAFDSVPAAIREQLLIDRDSHGNVQVSKIETEKLLIEQVTRRIADWQAVGAFPGEFLTQAHFFGYEGRSAAPSNFDADYAYALGHVAAVLTLLGRTGYLCSLGNLAAEPEDWVPRGVPLTSMMQMEPRKGRPTPVIGKALVRPEGAPFRAFAAERERWALDDDYVYPGALQYFGPPEVSARRALTLTLERET